MATTNQWLAGARPRTLPAAIAPVLVGAGAALPLVAEVGAGFVLRAAGAMLVALALQVGVNFANDYSDGIRGTDGPDRVGPFRLVGSGNAAPGAVKAAALACLGVAAAAGLLLAAVTAWWLLGVGAAAIAAAWYYTGGKRPYGYAGLGEVFVFVFFGLVAVLGTTFVLARAVSATAVAFAVGVGLLACAILVANNLRDVATDAGTGKRTLAVILGEHRTRLVYAVTMAVPFAIVAAAGIRHPWSLLALAALPLAARPVAAVLRGASGAALISVLAATGAVEFAYGALLLVGFVAAQ